MIRILNTQYTGVDPEQRRRGVAVSSRPPLAALHPLHPFSIV